MKTKFTTILHIDFSIVMKLSSKPHTQIGGKGCQIGTVGAKDWARRGGGMHAVSARRECRRPCVPYFAEDGDGLTVWPQRSARAAVERNYAAESCL